MAPNCQHLIGKYVFLSYSTPSSDSVALLHASLPHGVTTCSVANRWLHSVPYIGQRARSSLFSSLVCNCWQREEEGWAAPGQGPTDSSSASVHSRDWDSQLLHQETFLIFTSDSIPLILLRQKMIQDHKPLPRLNYPYNKLFSLQKCFQAKWKWYLNSSTINTCLEFGFV